MDTSSTDVLSLNGFEGASLSSIASGRVANHGDYNNVNMQDSSFIDQMQQAGDLSGNSTHGPVSNFTKQSNIQVLNSDYVDSLSKSDGLSNEVKQPVFLDEITSVDENAGKEEGLLDICGTIPGNCLPCLASAVPSVEKRRSLSSSSPSARKKGALKHSSGRKGILATLYVSSVSVHFYSCNIILEANESNLHSFSLFLLIVLVIKLGATLLII